MRRLKLTLIQAAWRRLTSEKTQKKFDEFFRKFQISNFFEPALRRNLKNLLPLVVETVSPQKILQMS